MLLVNFILANPDLVTLILTTIGGLIWHRGKSTKSDDLWEALLKIGRQAFPAIMRSAKLYDDAYVREQITKAIWAGLSRLGVKPTSPAIGKLVDEAVEHIHGELAEMVIKHHLGQVEKPLKATLEALQALPEAKPIEATP